MYSRVDVDLRLHELARQRLVLLQGEVQLDQEVEAHLTHAADRARSQRLNAVSPASVAV